MPAPHASTTATLALSNSDKTNVSLSVDFKGELAYCDSFNSSAVSTQLQQHFGFSLNAISSFSAVPANFDNASVSAQFRLQLQRSFGFPSAQLHHQLPF
jgi:ankyrin repeat protein